MIAPAQRAEIRRLFYAEHWRIGTIARELGLHTQTVRAALETERFNQRSLVRASQLDPYLPFVRATLEQYPRIRSTNRVVTRARREGTPRPDVRRACGA